MVATSERDLVVRLRNAQVEKKKAEQTLEGIKKKYNEAESALIEFLESNEMKTTAKYEGVGSFTLNKPRLHASCKIEDNDKLFEFLREHGRGDLIKTRVHDGSLSSFVSELVKDGTKIPEDFISIHYTTRLSYNKP